MNPDRSWANIIQNNPLNEDFIQQIKQIDGIEKIRSKFYLNGILADLDPENEITGASVTGLDPSYAKELENSLTDGFITYEQLTDGNQIIADSSMLHWYPELNIGSPIRIQFYTPDGITERTFKLAAIGNFSSGFAPANLILPESVLEDICPYDLTERLEITVNSEKKEQAYEQLQAMADSSEYLVTDNYEDRLKTWESTMALMSLAGYAFLIILGSVGIMNLINTMINSIYTRKQELGMMQAIGMSEKQLVRMMQMEGLFYTAGTLIVSLGLGSIAGYLVFLYAKAERMLNITTFHYPVLPAILLSVAVAVIQLFLTYGISKSFRRSSLIDRIRYSE